MHRKSKYLSKRFGHIARSFIALITLFAFTSAIVDKASSHNPKTSETETIDIADVDYESSGGSHFDFIPSLFVCNCAAAIEADVLLTLKAFPKRMVYLKVPLYIVLHRLKIPFI